MNKNTTVSKTIKTLAWVILSNAVIAGVSYVTNHKELFNPFMVAFANIVLVAVKNFVDPTVKNI